MASKSPKMLLCLDEKSAEPLYQQLYRLIRQQILSEGLKEGDKLPSIRALCQDLAVSHATVERAYLQLSLEGYVNNKPRSGYIVAPFDRDYFQGSAVHDHSSLDKAFSLAQKDAFLVESAHGRQCLYDFSFTRLQKGSFPRKAWAKLTNEVINSIDSDMLCAYSTSVEPDALQVELANHLRLSRGVNCRPEQIVFQPGTESALATIMQLLGDQVKRVGHEEPGFEGMTAVAQRFNKTLCPLPTDGSEGRYLQALSNSRPQLVFATPSHQFPTGIMMGLDVRTDLLRWAASHNAYIIEDDACNEYRYDVQAVPSLQSLDRHNRVIYVGNFSKALSPGLRVAYIVLPPELLMRWYEKFTFSWDALSYCQRQVLARFINEGYWDQHVRRMITNNKKRHDALLAALRNEFGDAVTISGIDSGMHLFVTVHNGMTQQQLLDSAVAQNANVYGAGRYYWSDRRPQESSVLIGFSDIDCNLITDGVKALRKAWLG